MVSYASGTGDEAQHTPIQKSTLQGLITLEKLEQLNSQDKQQFLSNFDWTDSTLETEERKDIEELLVEIHDIFARQRFNRGINQDFKAKLTPIDESPGYSQNQPTPINLKGDITVELALLHKCGIITTLPFSKYANPIFTQRKPNDKLRLLVQLCKTNISISDDYINKNHPVNTLTDSAQDMAGKQFILQTCLLPSIPLLKNGIQKICTNACV